MERLAASGSLQWMSMQRNAISRIQTVLFGAQGLGGRWATNAEGEVWFDSGLLGNPRRRSFAGDLSQAALMQPRRSAKRQHCGNHLQDEQYHNLVFESSGNLGSLSSTMSLEAEESMSNHSSGLVFPCGVNEQANRINTAIYPTVHAEVGSSSNLLGLTFISDITATGACWSGGSLQHRVSNSVEGHTNNLYPHVDFGSRSLHKRQSSVDGLATVLPCTAAFERRESDVARFPQGPTELLRSDTAASLPSFDNLTAWDGAQVTRDNHSHSGYHPLRVHCLPRDTASRISPPSSLYGASGVASHPGLIIRRHENGLMNESAWNMSIGLPEAVASGGNHGLSRAPWHGDNIYRDQNNNTSSLIGRREVYSSTDVGSHPMHRAPQNRVQLVDRACMSARLMDSTARLSYHPYALGGRASLQPFTRPPTLPRNRINNPDSHQGLLMIPSSTTSGSMFGQHQTRVYQPPQAVMAPMMPRNVELNRLSSSRRVSFRGVQSLPSVGSNNHYQPGSYGFAERVPSNGIEWVDIYDEHSNMRMDVDNMSYEELLALEERMGNVNTGLPENDIQKCLETSVHGCIDTTSEDSSQCSDSSCSICQEEYTEGDELGRLNCGHGYHTVCIKQWLALKNQCPICKAAAYCDP